MLDNPPPQRFLFQVPTSPDASDIDASGLLGPATATTLASVWTVPGAKVSSLEIFWNGAIQTPGALGDVTINNSGSSTTFTFNNAGVYPVQSDRIIVSYTR